MAHNYYWSPEDEAGLEHLHLIESEAGTLANGVVLRRFDDFSLRVHYFVQCDREWKTLKVEAGLLDSPGSRIALESDGEGHWRYESGSRLEALDGCLDVDIMVTPYTNTLPIRRLGLDVGQAAEIAVVYISFPELDVSRMRQRYTRLEDRNGRQAYLYENVETVFSAELVVDVLGVVIDYAKAFRRIWPR
ncbi:MAG TPA: putative glycolipid-binding domain-containing protein [Blastocatellia bacterium]|jgi:hypothetical protein|nr:putative glycolipid-binding domain-containing protein [Blastocatellia bacterium]